MKTNIPLAYTRTGKGSPLVLIHGFPLDRSIWNEIVPHLEDHFDLIMPDLRGFGGSKPVDAPYTMTDMAGDILALLDSLEIAEASLAGHSMGGYVALAFAKLHPERTRGLALVSSQAGGDDPERKQGRYKTADEVSNKGAGVVVDAMGPKLTADARIGQFARELMAGQSVPGITGGLKAMAEREDLRSSLASFPFPLVLIHGDADELVPVEMARDAQARANGATLVELPGVGHLPMLEAAEQTAEGLMLLP
ncbi:MAG TPA: alpha/beta hydrolase [Anaerolineales bacterium]|nr:alpha/beta hydrolase [Anaerolineales bacterium]